MTSTAPVGIDPGVVGDDGPDSSAGHPVAGHTTLIGESNATAPRPLFVDQKLYAQGATLVVTYNGLSGHAGDWIGLYHVGASDADVSAWTYTPGTASGRVSFNVNLAGGTYVARSFVMDSYDRVAESAPFAIAPADATVSIDRNTYTDADPIVVTYAGFTDDPTDWITIVPANAPDAAYEQYFYTNGTTQGRLTFDAVPPGEYEVRGHFTNSDNYQAAAAFTVVAR